VPARDFDCGAPFGIAQAHKGEIQLQRSDQHIGKPGGNGRRFSSHPRRRDVRKCYQLSERCSQRDALGMRFRGHLVRRARTFASQLSLPQFEEKLIGRNEERVLLKNAADNYDWVRPHDVHNHSCSKFEQIVRTDHRIVILGKNIIEACLVLQQVVHGWFIEQCPIHMMSHQPGKRVAGRCARLD
jgi:hypothetical protein